MSPGNAMLSQLRAAPGKHGLGPNSAVDLTWVSEPSSGALGQLQAYLRRPEQTHRCHKLFLLSFLLSLDDSFFEGQSGECIFKKKNPYCILVASREGKEIDGCRSVFIFFSHLK